MRSKKPRAVKPFSTKGLPNHARWPAQVAARLALAADGESIMGIAMRTGSNFETVRRYLRDGRVPARFVAAFCLAFEVEPRWVLFGDGDTRSRERRH